MELITNFSYLLFTGMRMRIYNGKVIMWEFCSVTQIRHKIYHKSFINGKQVFLTLG